MTKDHKVSYLTYIESSYHYHEKVARIDFFLKKAIRVFNEKGYKTEFCCSGHTDEKGLFTLEQVNGKMCEVPYRPNCYILFKENYNFPKQELYFSKCVLRFQHCGTLMGIKKACRKMYRIAQSLPNLNEVSK